MFTGIVSELGEVESVETGDEGARIRIKAASPPSWARVTRWRSTAPA